MKCAREALRILMKAKPLSILIEYGDIARTVVSPVKIAR